MKKLSLGDKLLAAACSYRVDFVDLPKTGAICVATITRPGPEAGPHTAIGEQENGEAAALQSAIDVAIADGWLHVLRNGSFSES